MRGEGYASQGIGISLVVYTARQACHGVLSRSQRPTSPAATPLVFIVVAGLCEIAGGYLVWQWWRQGAP
jgi:Uncharacterised BCR, YnfA/UPF0060 family